jgi:hypothetical protein
VGNLVPTSRGVDPGKGALRPGSSSTQTLKMLMATVVIALFACACANGAGAIAAQECATAAKDYSGTSVAAFATTVGAMRGLAPRGGFDSRWPDLAADHAASLCYIDADAIYAPQPAPGPGQSPFPEYNRAIIAVVDGTPELLVAGYRDLLPIQAPSP